MTLSTATPPSTGASNFLNTASFTGGEGRDFPARVEVFEREKSVFNGQEKEQYHLGVRPLTFEIKGTTGLFQSWYSVSKSKNSTLYKFVTALEETGFTFTKDDGSDLKGKIFMFARREFEFGTNKQTGETIKSKPVLIPVKMLTESEAAALVAEAGSRTGTGAVGGTVSAAVPSIKAVAADDFTPEELASLAKILDGQNKVTSIPTVVKAGVSHKLIQAVIDGRAVNLLKSSGGVTEDESGTYHASTPDSQPG